MTRHVIATLAVGFLGCGGPPSADTTPATSNKQMAPNAAGDETTPPVADPDREKNGAGEFKINETDKSSRPKQAKLKPTKTAAAIRFLVLNKDKGPVQGIVISLTAPQGEKYFTPETDSEGFTEILVPNGRSYELVYLSLGRRDVSAKVDVADTPNLNLKLTLRYQREEYPTSLVLDEVQFPTGSAILTGESRIRLDPIVEYMTHKKTVRIEISGHTDNVGNRKKNKRLSQQRADAVRAYVVSKGIAPDRINAVGYGDEKPIAPNDSSEGRQKNRRIEAKEIGSE